MSERSDVQFPATKYVELIGTHTRLAHLYPSANSH